MTDDELLELLGSALVPQASEPSLASIASLHRALRSSSPRRGRKWRPAAVAACAGLVIAGSGGVALAATGAVLPALVRRVAYDLRIPVDSPELARARSQIATLRTDLVRDDRPGTATAADQLRDQLRTLRPSDAAKVSGQAEELLARADRQQGQRGEQGQQGQQQQQGPDAGAGRSTQPTQGSAPGPEGTPSTAGTSGSSNSGQDPQSGNQGAPSGSRPGNGSPSGDDSQSGGQQSPTGISGAVPAFAPRTTSSGVDGNGDRP